MLHKASSSKGSVRFGDLFSADQIQQLRQGIHEDKVLVRGDVLWFTLPQTLWHKLNPENNSHKRRPFLVLDQEVKYEVDGSGLCTTPLSVLGIGLTQYANFVPGRPHISFRVPGSIQKSYAWFDMVRTTDIGHIKVGEPIYRLSSEELKAMSAGLDQSLQPTFSLNPLASLGKAFGVGRLCDVSAKGVDETSGLVLLQHPLYSKKVGFAKRERPPYLLAAFKQTGTEVSDHAQGLDRLNIIHVNGNALSASGKTRDATKARELLNMIRQRAGLDPLPPPSLKNQAQQLFSRLGMLIKSLRPDQPHAGQQAFAAKNESFDY